MKLVFSIFFSFIIFMASFQSSLFYFDYKINRDFYEAHCINKAKPELECNGKCKVREGAQKSETPISEIKYAFEFNIIPLKSIETDFKKPFEFKNKKVVFPYNPIFTLDGYLNILPHPPQNLA